MYKEAFQIGKFIGQFGDTHPLNSCNLLTNSKPISRDQIILIPLRVD
jgi:hypothetical protein